MSTRPLRAGAWHVTPTVALGTMAAALVGQHSVHPFPGGVERILHRARFSSDTPVGRDVHPQPGHRSAAQTALQRAREVLDNDPSAPFVHALLSEAETRIGRVAVRSATRTGVLLDSLTDREMSILRMLTGTASQREIGAVLFLSVSTVKAYNKSLYRKLGRLRAPKPSATPATSA